MHYNQKRNTNTNNCFLKKKHVIPLQPISALNAIESMYMPQYVRYCIEGEEYFQMFYHTPAKIRKRTKDINENMNLNFEPLDILEDFSKGVPEIATPNVKGVRWFYSDAISKTLLELEPQIISGLQKHGIDPDDQNLLLISSIKDGADGMGEISVHKEQSDRFLPDKAFRFSFCVIKIDVKLESNEIITIFDEEKPNSVRCNRPLLESLCDENNHSSTSICLLPIENERNFLKDKILKIETTNG